MKQICSITLVVVALALCSSAFAAEHKHKAATETTATTTAQHVMLTPADLKWGDPPPGLPAGAKLAVLEGDPTKKGEFTVRLQAPDGYKVAPHTHPTAEKITVISGTLFLGSGAKFDESAAKELSQGSFGIMPAGMQHFAWAKGDTIIQIHGPGPFQIKYVNPADDPRNAKQ